ncbi:lipopolysaccharide biosynthesis protein [Rhizobium sp. C1]|uniref:lipopolysaccharide biosynthesis protein n=1 Tax=Rhizobium sp. C1 TaxID=1349799 RepID=UPI001E3803E5|nr:lipopolysaccharide biosynthesis protein [Rhizobium sp. C1]MCD2179377.1 lipopolysaccharide biosynthesis protein [Rhizobium sp. C1]
MVMLVAVLKGGDAQARAQRMALSAFAIRVVSAAIAFVSQIILARLMGNFEYGLFTFVWVMTILIGNLSCLGFHTTIIRFLPEYREAGAHAEIRGLTSTARLFAMTVATTIGGLGLVALHFLGDRIESYYVAPLFLAVFALPMVALGDVQEGTGRANSWPIAALTPTYIIRPLLILIFMAASVKAGYPPTAHTAMVSALAAVYLASIGQFIFVITRIGKNYPAEANRIDFGNWFKVAVPIFFIEGFVYLLTNSDVVIVGFYLNPTDVAIYFAAAKTMALVHFVFFSVKAAASARFSMLWAAGDRDGLANFARQAARWSFWPSLAIGLLVLLAGKLLLSLFGHAFVAGYPLLAILLVGILAKASIGPGEALLAMVGEQRRCVAIYIMALAVNLALNMTLIPVYGLYGVAIATSGAMVFEALALHITIRRRLGITLSAFVFAPTKSENRGET